MGNRITFTQTPVIMNAQFLEEIVIRDMVSTQELDISTLRKLVKLDGLEYGIIFTLKMQNQRLVNIDDLWRYQFLTTVEIQNNLLDEIEGFDCLINLQNLDLSFNHIKCISGLKNLINLVKLNLTSNEIITLEKMESLKRLETFFIRYNKIKSFDNIFYLTQFKNLISLGIDKNPLMQNEDAKFHIISVLPHLKSLDFDMITKNQLQKAFKRFPPEKNVEKISEEIYKKSEKDNFKCPFLHLDKNAYVDGLANGQGFQSLLLSDKNFELLHTFPLVSKIAKDHYSETTEIFDKWHEKGHIYYEQIQQEKSDFLSMISKAKNFSLEVFREKEMIFMNFKEIMPKKLCLIYQNCVSDDERDKNVSELKEKCEICLQETFQTLMNSICIFLDLVLNMSKIYEKEVVTLNKKYVQEIDKYIEDIISIDKIFTLQLQQFYLELCDSEFDSTMEFKTEDVETFNPSPTFLQLIHNKELIRTTLKLSQQIHSTSLTERRNNLKSALLVELEETIHKVKEEAFFMQTKQTRNNVTFYNKQKNFIDKFFSRNNSFKHYLGYR